jgi:DNA-directed RNA polymerase specialized sigma24 family protein
MKPAGSVTRWIAQLHSKDPKVRNEAARQIWLRYFAKLLDLARINLNSRIRRRESEEDVLQSMYKSICLRIERGLFALEDRNDLWAMLVTMTLNKARTVATRHTRKARDVRREQGLGDAKSDDSSVPEWALEQMDASDPSPPEAVLLSEQFEKRLQCLTPDLRQIALWRLDGFSNQEIAEKLNRVERTVERKLEMIRKKWAEVDWD